MEEKIQLTDVCEPPLRAGSYEVELTEIAEKGPSVNFKDRTKLVVTSRRFRLEPDEIYSVYPPKDSSGEYSGCIPHLVFNRDTIPWERQLIQKEKQKACPWLFLLLLEEGEDFYKHEMTIGQSLKEQMFYMGNRRGLTEESMEQEDDSCTVLDLSTDFAASVLPDWEEVCLLSHGRLVSLENKVTDESVRDGWFSCTAASRYVREGGKDPVKYTVCLVSLEGMEEVLRAAGPKEKKRCMGQAEKVRLFVLYEWAFASTTSPYDFSSIIRHLKADTLCGNVKETVQTKELCRLLERGFYPVNHQLRDGSRTVSWYRGPFLPQCEEREPFYYHVFSDQMYKYDPEMGMFDMSYAAAWQLGRMLVFQNLSICRQLIQWRFENYRSAAKQQQTAEVMGHVQRECRENCQGDSLEALLTKQCKSMLKKDSFAEREYRAVKTSKEDSVPVYSNEYRADIIKNDIQRETYFQGINGEETTQLPEPVREFIMECSLFYHIPFWYLVPDTDMLQEEELRFFQVDTDWILRLMDGMCSIGRNASIDYQHDTVLLQNLYEQLVKKNGAIRRKKQGAEDVQKEKMKASDTGDLRCSGFLLRSVLVKDFRGLEFQAYDAPEKGSRLEALRLDLLGESVLIGIFRGEIRRLVIGQPPEGLHFGFDWAEDGQGKTGIKYLRGLKNGILSGEQAEVVLKEEGSCHCLDIKKTKDSIAGKLKTEIGSAGFALQMIKNAHSGVFRIGV